jgi:plasmid stability protein
MEDKELFEKVEKTFNLKQSKKIDETFSKGNFKKLLNEVLTPKDPSSGGGSSLLGQFGSAVKYLSPTQARIRKAQAQQAEIATAKARQDLLDGDEKPDVKIEADEFTEAEFKRNPQFKIVFSKAAKGVQLSVSENEVYKKGIAAASKARTAAKKDVKAGEKGALERLSKAAGENKMRRLGEEAPNITKILENPKNIKLKTSFVDYLIQSDEYGRPSEKEIIQLADKLTPVIQKNMEERAAFIKRIRENDNIPNKGAGLIKLLPAAPKRQTSGKAKKVVLSPKTVDAFLKSGAAKSGRSVDEHKKEMVRQALKYEDKIGGNVRGARGGVMKLMDIDRDTGLMTLKTLSGQSSSKTVYKFANQLGGEDPAQSKLQLS